MATDCEITPTFPGVISQSFGPPGPPDPRIPGSPGYARARGMDVIMRKFSAHV